MSYSEDFSVTHKCADSSICLACRMRNSVRMVLVVAHFVLRVRVRVFGYCNDLCKGRKPETQSFPFIPMDPLLPHVSNFMLND